MAKKWAFATSHVSKTSPWISTINIWTFSFIIFLFRFPASSTLQLFFFNYWRIGHWTVYHAMNIGMMHLMETYIKLPYLIFYCWWSRRPVINQWTPYTDCNSRLNMLLCLTRFSYAMKEISHSINLTNVGSQF